MAPSFFKYILSSEKVAIPKDFVLQMSATLAHGTIFLRDRYNNTWPIEISRDGDEWYLNRGWEQFFRESCLKMGDFVTFVHKGGNILDIKLYGSNCCGKKGANGPAMPGVIKEEPMDYEPDEEQKHEEKPLEENGLDSVKEEEEGDEVPMDNNSDEDEKQEENSLDEDGFDSVKEEDEEEEEVEEEEDNDDDNSDLQELSLDAEDNSDSDNVEEDDDYVKEEEEKHINNQNRANSSKVRKRKLSKASTPKRESRRKTGYCYAYHIFDSGLARRPKDGVPYFVSRSRPKSRTQELPIPKDVIDDYNLKIPKELWLVDEAGAKYRTVVKRWSDNRLWCTRGWKQLCKENQIKPNDFCLCEFVRKKGSEKIKHLLVRRMRLSSV